MASFITITCDLVDVLANQQYFQEVFICFADAMIRGEYPAFAPRVWRERGADVVVSEENAADLMAGRSDILVVDGRLSVVGK